MNSKIDKELVRKRFSKYLAAYDSLAVVQQTIAETLAGHFSGCMPQKLGSVLEIGCGTGFLTRQLLKHAHIKKSYLNDLVEQAPLLLGNRLQSAPNLSDIVLLPGDAEVVPFPEAIDLVASASVLQWLEDLRGFFSKTAAALRPGGWFVFNLFGTDNLHQMKALTGSGLRYFSPEEIRQWLEERFEVVELTRQTIRQQFDSPFDVLRHLQQTGVTATGEFRWTPGSLRCFERDYVRLYSESGGVFLDWDVMYVIARKI